MCAACSASRTARVSTPPPADRCAGSPARVGAAPSSRGRGTAWAGPGDNPQNGFAAGHARVPVREYVRQERRKGSPLAGYTKSSSSSRRRRLAGSVSLTAHPGVRTAALSSACQIASAAFTGSLIWNPIVLSAWVWRRRAGCSPGFSWGRIGRLLEDHCARPGSRAGPESPTRVLT
jgi:hypothetical protein